MNNNLTAVIIVALIGSVFMGFISAIAAYNIKINTQYIELLHSAKDPLAARCAWTGDQQVCLIVGTKR